MHLDLDLCPIFQRRVFNCLLDISMGGDTSQTDLSIPPFLLPDLPLPRLHLQRKENGSSMLSMDLDTHLESSLTDLVLFHSMCNPRADNFNPHPELTASSPHIYSTKALLGSVQLFLQDCSHPRVIMMIVPFRSGRYLGGLLLILLTSFTFLLKHPLETWYPQITINKEELWLPLLTLHNALWSYFTFSCISNCCNT